MGDQKTPTNLASRNQLLLIGGGALVLTLLVVALWYLFLYTPYAPAFTRLKTDDAALIVDELKKQKTPYQLADDGTTINVPEDQIDAARLAILGGGLPLKGTVGFELFNKSDMGLTEFAQKINYQRALQGELARTLMSFNNVENARVHITLPDDGVFRDDRRPAKASVTLAPKIGAQIDARTVIGIQRLTSSAVEGLDAMNVVVLDEAGQQLSGDAPLSLPNFPANGMLSPVEQAYAGKVKRAIEHAVQDPDMRVVVTAQSAAPRAKDSQQDSSGPRDASQPAPPSPSASAQLGKRHFPLRITVLLSREPEAGLKARLLPLLQSEMGFGELPGDSFDLIARPGSSPFDVGQPVATASGRPQPRSETTRPQLDIVAVGLICLTMMIAFMLGIIISRRKRSASLSSGEREAFAARLRNLIAERSGNADT